MLSYNDASRTTHIMKEHIDIWKAPIFLLYCDSDLAVIFIIQFGFFTLMYWYNFHGLISRHSSLEYIKRCCGVHFIDFSNNEENKFMLQTRADTIFCYIEINAASIMHELMIFKTSANIKLVEMSKCQHTF